MIGTLDPNPTICGTGVLRLRMADIEVALSDPDQQVQIETIDKTFRQFHLGHRHELRMAARRLGYPAPDPISDISGGQISIHWNPWDMAINKDVLRPVLDPIAGLHGIDVAECWSPGGIQFHLSF